MKQLNFGKIKTKLPLPDLLEMQRQSFTDFLQLDTEPARRELKGLQAAFEDVFPIEAPDGSMKLEFVKYDLSAPKYATPAEAAMRDGTFSAPLKAWLRLFIKQKNGALKEVKEEAGLEVEAERVVAILDKHKNNPAKSAHRVTKVFILCKVIGGEFQPNLETIGSAYFELNDLPQLSLGKNTPEQIALCFEACHAKHWETRFD
jgi:hypothetical protein